jgi:putative ATP-dependent endonuclease of the OLD family
MKIVRIRIRNFRSIESLDETFENFNVLVGQNNHGKTNFFEALDWFFNGFKRGVTKDKLIFSECEPNKEISVDITFTGLQEAINGMGNETKKKALKKIFDTNDEIVIRRTTEFDDGKKRQLFHLEENEWKNTMGADGTWNDLLPHLEYVHTRVTLDEVGSYKSRSPIAEMLSGVLTSIVETDEKYIELKRKFEALFGDSSTSKVRTQLDNLGGKVEVYLQKQFPDQTSVKFNVDIPEFTDLLKKFSTQVDDGVPTSIEEKGDGMQRAVMLSIIQAYADFRKEKETSKRFIFLIDEAEIHLHPSAQRALKAALLDISEAEDQVYVNTHSSVLVVDKDNKQKTFKVEKRHKRTSVTPIISPDDKMDLIYDLLGGSPADLLLPKNFIIVEGQSEYEFMKIVKDRFYSKKYSGIKILFARGAMDKAKEVFHAIHETYKPLFVEDGIYKKTTIILCDKPNTSNKAHYDSFLESHPWIEVGEQMQTLPVDALEKYYPSKYQKTNDEIKQLEVDMKKVEYAREVASGITQKQFEEKMSIAYKTLSKALEKAL